MAESVYPCDDQLAGLVEAATAAADQEVEWSHNDGAGGPVHRVFEGDELHGLSGETYPTVHSGQYDPSLRCLHHGGRSQALTRTRTRKRKRATDSLGAGDHFADEQAAGRPTQQQFSPNPNPPVVHSAAALFRTPSTSSKKYTRPPMSKLFSSLQLLPEDFLHLQSAAKAYMLDDHHPERRDCVGQRGKTDSDMVKLKLWNCVQQFLDREGNGERFFGVNARKTDSDGEARPITWPENAQHIVKICVPLLRRMVTNERQRRYAVESRKGGGDCQREAHGRHSKQSGHQASKATVHGTDGPDTFESPNIDMFGDGLIPDSDEATKWYNVYNSDAVLDNILVKSGFPRVLFLQMIINIDGHCRLYHGDEGALCNNACKTRLVERLLDLPMYQQHAPAGDPKDTVRDVFDIILARLSLISYWKNPVSGNTAPSSAAGVIPARCVPNSNPSKFGKTITSSTTEGVDTADGRTSDSSMQLVIHIVHKDKCLLPSFDIPSTECPNLDALRTQIRQHYSAATLLEKRVISLSEACLKVWLPDGLVRVKDDGQWMVALLSAGTVEWMGGQMRVLLEI